MKHLFEYTYSNTNQKWPQILSIFIACISTLTVGMQITWTSPSISILISNSSLIEPITLEEASYFTVIQPIAAIITGPIFAKVVDVIGRKKIVVLIAVPEIISFLLIAFAENTTLLYISRFMAGIGDAIHYNVLPMYIGEIAMPNVRGSWGNAISVNNFLGGLLMNIIGAYNDIRTAAYICVCVPILQLILTCFLPESPYFLLMKGETQLARESLQALRWTSHVDEELNSLQKDVNRQISEPGTFKDLFIIPVNRRALLVVIGIRATQQFGGLMAFTIYTQYMFAEMGSNISASTSAIIFCATLAACSFIFALVVDKFGRRFLMIFSSVSSGIVLLIEAAFFFIDQKTELDVTTFKWIPLVGMLVYLVVCTSGLGMLPTLMLGELFSASIKGKALYLSNLFFSLCILSVSKIFQSLASSFGMHVPFCAFAACCFLGAFFSYFYVPETKGKTLEQIQQSLRGNKI